MNATPSPKNNLSGEEIAATLNSLGVDPTAERVEQLQARIVIAGLPAGDRETVVRDAVSAANRALDEAGTGDRMLQEQPPKQLLAYRVVKQEDRRRFDLSQPSVLKLDIPYSAEMPGTDMGEQVGGIHYLKRGGGWGGGLLTAARYTVEGAELHRQSLLKEGCVGVEVVDANVLEARVQVMIAVAREMEETLSRAEYLALRERIKSLPDEIFAKAVPDLVKTGDLAEPLILSVSRLGVVAERRQLHEKATSLPSTPALYNNGEDYADVHSYIKTNSGEWRFTVSLDKNQNRIYDGEVHFSPSDNAPFEVSAEPDPEAVAAFAPLRGSAVKILQSLQGLGVTSPRAMDDSGQTRMTTQSAQLQDMSDHKKAAELVYGIVAANGESLSEFTAETLVGSIAGFVSRARQGLDLVTAGASIRDGLSVQAREARQMPLPAVEGVDRPTSVVAAGQFMRELLDSVETLSGIVDAHGARTLADLMYLQNAIMNGTFIDHYPGESAVSEVVKALPSGARWLEYVAVQRPEAEPTDLSPSM